jgi:peptidoglycan biosynthesis protein MviN/MurJ (putative lipid II flippase)
LSKAGIYRIQPNWVPFALRLVVATAMMAIAVWRVVPETAVWNDWLWQQRAYELALVCGAGIATYIGVHWLAGTRLHHLRPPVLI